MTLTVTDSTGTSTTQVFTGQTVLRNGGASATTSQSVTVLSRGYWEVGRDGGVFAFGSAGFFGSLPGSHIDPHSPISGIASTTNGRGYWLVGQDGGTFAYGNAKYFGSLPASHIVPNAPIAALAATPNDGGYWELGSDGGVFAFGDAGFYGSMPKTAGAVPVRFVALIPTGTGKGYWLVDSRGEVFPFGDATALGVATSGSLPRPIDAAAANPEATGLWLAGPGGSLVTLGAATNAGSFSRHAGGAHRGACRLRCRRLLDGRERRRNPRLRERPLPRLTPCITRRSQCTDLGHRS